MKKCRFCSRDKEDFNFNQNQNWCKECQSAYKKQWRIDNKDHIKSYKSQYDVLNNNSHRDYLREYRINNKRLVAENRRQYVNDKRVNDPVFRLNDIVSGLVNKSLRKLNSSKNGESKSKYLPYTMQELKEHLEKQFEPWMNWCNHGTYNCKTWNDDNWETWTWNIDHVIPRSNLPYSNMNDDNFQKCWALSNLRPLNAKTNIMEGSRKRK